MIEFSLRASPGSRVAAEPPGWIVRHHFVGRRHREREDGPARLSDHPLKRIDYL